ncbi:MAG: OmpA family protein [Pseudomonadota bacterium]
MRLIFGLAAAASVVFSVMAAAQSFGTVNFDFDSTELDAEARAELQVIAQRITAASSYKPTVVVGYTDAVGSTGYNDGLGLRRARAVADALVALGVPVSRIGTVSSRGERELLVAVTTPERRNRRVNVTLDDLLAACRTYREINITPASVGDALQSDLRARLSEALDFFEQLEASGANGPAFQMAGAAREDCASAVGYRRDAARKAEYAQKCICNSARMRVALNAR